jgi:type IV secretory pathway TraG/TraD family ATPase VirD4
MNTTSTWGRKETIVWPPHAPVYVCTALAVAFLATLGFVWQRFAFAQSTLQKSYTATYIRALAEGAFTPRGEYRLIYVGGGKRAPRLALPADFEDGETVMPDGKKVPIVLSPAAKREGYSFFYRGPERGYANAALSAWLRAVFFDGNGPLQTYALSLAEGAGFFAVALPFAVGADVRRYKELKYGRRLKGPVMLTPRQFNKTLKGTGLGIRTGGKRTILRLPRSAEPKHIQIMGDTGAGKSTLLMGLLQQIADRGDAAIVYDPAGEFTQRFYRPERGDWILNPLDARSPYWSPASELRTPAEARTIAASLYQSTEDKKGEFFTQTPQKIFAHLLKYRPTPQQLVEWMSNEAEIDCRVAGTELAAMIAKGAMEQRSGVLASLGLVADSLRLLPTKEQANGREWSATEWAGKREGWIFLTSTEAEQEALRPLHSLWIDLLILRLLTTPKPGQKRAWLVIDELASLQRLPQFHTALTKGRKSDNPIVFGYQGKAQLEVVYGHLAEVMLSQPSTKFILKTAEPKAAKWASELIGEVEIERVRETVADGKRAGKSFVLDRQIEPLVMASEIEGLADLHTFVKLGNYVSRFSFPHRTMPLIAAALVPREIPEETMWFNPLAETAAQLPEEEAAPVASIAPPSRPAPAEVQPTPEAATTTPERSPVEGANGQMHLLAPPNPMPGNPVINL